MKTETEFENNLLSLDEFNQSKFAPLIPIKDIGVIGVEKAQVAYWRREGLLPFVEKGKWANVSFVEAIWLMVLNDLRRFGVGTDVMKNLKAYFIDRAYRDNVPKQNLLHNKALLQKKKDVGTLSEEDKRTLTIIEQVLGDSKLLHAFQFDVNYFSNLITESVAFKLEAAILIFLDGQVVQQVFGGVQSSNGAEVDFSRPHLRLSLTHYLRTFIHSEELTGFLLLTHLFNEDEERVLREMRNKNVHEITITMKDGKPQRIDAQKNGQLAGAEADRVRQLLALKNYESITLNTRDEKTLMFKKTTKQILK
jgi:hypothetical protein